MVPLWPLAWARRQDPAFSGDDSDFRRAKGSPNPKLGARRITARLSLSAELCRSWGTTLRKWILAPLILLVASSGLWKAESAPRRVAQEGPALEPNVLIVVTDDQRASDGTMKVLGRTRRRIQRNGVRYPNAFATTPVCCPSRASILTGRYAHNHGVKNNYDAERLDPSTAMPLRLQAAGYVTGLFGKYLNFWRRTPPGFDQWAMHFGRNRYYDGSWNVNGQRRDISTYNADFVADKAVEFLKHVEEEDDLQPWFAYVTPLGPHAPYRPARRHENAFVPRFEGNPAVFEKDLSDKPRFVRVKRATLEKAQLTATKQLRTLLAIDEMFARIDRTLADLGEVQNTLVMFLSDNGYTWAEHGLLSPGRSKNTPYLPATKIPMVMRFPGRLPAGTSDGRLVANVDVAPTVYDAAGILQEVTPPVDGRSLLDPTWDRQRLLLERFFQPELEIPAWASVQTKRFQYTEYRRGDSIRFKEFYRLRADPWQIDNVLRDGTPGNDPNKRRLHRQLRRLRRCRGTTGTRACP